MARYEDDWPEPHFDDPRQLAMSFAVRPEDDFETFHQKNPNIWREFRKSVLDKFNAGIRVINIGDVMKEVTCGTVLKHEIIEKYWKLFISNHQELENVFSIINDSKPTTK